MPLLPTPGYRPAFPFTGSHVQTMYPTLFRPTPEADPERERLETPDGDFLDIDWHRCSQGTGSKIAIVSHGLEGHARKKYPLGMARHLSRHGWDVICLNFRCCSGEPNRLPRFYHSGITDDLHQIICHALQKNYEHAALIGFSMGGNQTLKYLGENPDLVPARVKASVVFSVPCHLADAVKAMDKPGNKIYMRYFMKGLHQKIREKAKRFPGLIDVEGLEKIMKFEPFDNKYTAPLHGFTDADDYYKRCSSAQFLPAIRIPTLLVQALNDPFLSRSCYPIKEAQESRSLYLEIPEYGGHVGFVGSWLEKSYWSEKRAVAFLESVV